MADENANPASNASSNRAGATLLWVALALVPLCIFAVMIWQRRWISDDGFINIRVVQNLLAGHGPVFNIGERVEAYTSTLWLGFLAFFSALGIRPERVAAYGGLSLSLLGALMATWAAASLHRWNHTQNPRHSRGLRAFRGMVPLGLLSYVVLSPAWDFGTSGLETGLSLAWLGGSYGLLSWLALGEFSAPEPDAAPPKPRPDRHFYAAGFLFGLAPLIRPELALFSVGFLLPLLMLFFRPERGGFKLRKFVQLGLAMGSVPVGYQLFRMGYFAALVPNTAYAKEAFESRWTQGGHFFKNFFFRYKLLIPLSLLGVAWAASVQRALQGAGTLSRGADPATRAARMRFLLLAIPALCGLGYCIYVVKVGGGFMHGRLFLPGLFGLLLPVMSVPVCLEKLRGGRWNIERIFLAAFVIAWAVYCGSSLRVPEQNEHGIGDERGWYTRAAGIENPVMLEDYDKMFFVTEARGFRAYARSYCAEVFGKDHDFFEALAVSRSLGSGWKPPAGCRPVVDGKRPQATPFGRIFPPQKAYDIAPQYVERGIALVLMRTAMGMQSLVLGPHTHLVDHAGLTSPVSSRLVLEHRGRPGHEKKLPTPWMIGRFSAAQPGEDPRVSAARQALQCGELGALIEATSTPLSAGQFLQNIANAFRFHELRIPVDPVEAMHKFCATEPPTRLIAGGDGGHDLSWYCPRGYALSGFRARVSNKGDALAEVRPECRPIVNSEAIKAQKPARLEGPPAPAPTFGARSKNPAKTTTCPAHLAVVGLRGAHEKFVQQATPICAALDDPAPLPDTLGQAAPGAEPFELRCPPGTIATGMTARAGALIDAVGLLCAPPPSAK